MLIGRSTDNAMNETGPERPRAVEPYIPASRTLPELTIKALLLGVVLSVLLAGANAYLGLLAGMTVSASIPAAVISMAVLRLFKRSNILENNNVQTAASSGESLAAGVIFTLPALIMIGAWSDFSYLDTLIIAGLGGVLGVVFTIPLRRAMIVEQPLTFPEGVATAEVLKVGDTGGSSIRRLILGAAVGAIFALGDVAFHLWSGITHAAFRVGHSIAFVGTELKPSLVAVGYIVGINIAVLVFLGGAINWYIAIPIYSAASDWPVYQLEGDAADPSTATVRLALEQAPADVTSEMAASIERKNAEIRAKVGTPASAEDWAAEIWQRHTRYIGVGAMVIGGLWALLRLWRSLVAGVRSSLRTYRAVKQDASGAGVPRTDRDIPVHYVAAAMLFSLVPLYFVFRHVTHDNGIALLMSFIMLIAGFLFSAVAAYMAGIVGSSNNPISGVTIATLLMSSLLLLALGIDHAIGPAAAILIGAVVASAAAIGGDNMQDLKAGRLLGATPWKQQIMQTIGVLAGAFAIAPILSLLMNAYGFGEPTTENPHALLAPQATLMASIAQGVFEMNLPWTMIAIGAGVALLVIIIDIMLERAGSVFRMPVLAVAVGMYLPLELSVPILIGGFISWAAHRFHMRGESREAEGELKISLSEARQVDMREGLLMAAGLIAGEAIIGILVAIPIVLSRDKNVLALIKGDDYQPPAWPGMALLAVVIILLLRVATRTARRL